MRVFIPLLFILLFNIVVFSQDIGLSANSAEKYNKRGFFKNENLTLNGNEIISDYDGNLMVNYSTKINLPADQSGDFTITYNANVDHRFFDDLETPTQGHMVNSPEWILGFRGFALQTLNFETNFFATHTDITKTSYQGEEIPLLIPGYHYGNALAPLLNDQYYDYFNILRADGSKIVLQNIKDHEKTGLYKEVGFEAKGFAIVEKYTNPDDPGCTTYRRIFYKPGDGFTYIFEEKKVSYYGNFDNSTCYDQAPRVLYLAAISSPGSWKYGYSVLFSYTDAFPNANITYGRKLFTSLKLVYNNTSYNGSAKPALAVNYGYNRNSLLVIYICNYNTNKNLTLNLSAPNGSSIGLFETGRDINSMRKLNVTSITDDLGRTDSFLYYNWTQDICRRTYINASKSYYYKFPLLNSINYYTGKSSVFNYFGNLFTGYDQSSALNFGEKGYMASNRDYAYRDCFTNFMLKSHELWNKYGTTVTLASKEIYTYSFDNSYYGKLSVNGIKTTIEDYEGSSKTRTTVKNYSNFRTNKPAFNASDFEHTIKLMSENVSEEAGPGVIEKYYTYDVGNPDSNTDPCYNGTMDLWKIREIKKDVSASTSSERIDSISYTYENCNLSYNGYSLVRPIKRTETKIDPNQLVHFTEYLNLFPTASLTNYSSNYASIIDTTVYDNNQYLYSIGLPKEEKIFRSGEISSDILKEYYERGYLANKLKKVTNNTNANRKSYNIYTYFTGPSYMSLLSAIDNDKGARQEFYYPNTTNFQETIPGIIVKYDQSRIQSNFYHCGYQIQPFKTLTISTNPAGVKDTLINYSSYNPDGTPEFTVDENKLHSAFAYDKAGRLISAALPGSFIDGTTAFVPHSDYSMNTNFVYNESSYTTNSYSYGAPYIIISNNFERGGSSTNIENNTQRYYCFLSSAIYASSGINKAILRLRIQCTNNTSGEPSAIVIGGIKTSYSSNKSCDSYSIYSSVYATVSAANGHYIDLDVDVTPLITALGTSEALYGFRISPSADSRDMNLNTSMSFEIEESPVCTGYFNAPGAVPGNPIDKQPNITGTIVYSYDDLNNIVTEKRRVTSDPNQANIKEVISKEVLDGMGLSRQNSVINDGGSYEVKGTDTYNSEGKVLTHTDGEGRTATSSYDFLQRLKTQSYGDGTSKNIFYTVQPNTISNGSYSASYTEYTRAVDENQKEVYTYYDKVGNKVAEKVGTNPPTIFRYDSFYRIDSVISPNQKIRTYSYDELGNLKQKDSPSDEGTTNYKYDKYKRLRFSKNEAAPSGERGITFTKYDQFGRVLVTGTLTSTYGFDSLYADKDYSINQGQMNHFENYQADTSNFVTVNMYDKYLKSGIFASMPDPFWWSASDANSSRNLKGKLVLTAFRDKPGQGWNYRIYLYGSLGHVSHIYQKVGTSPWKLIAKGTNSLNNITLEYLYKIEGGSQTFELAIWNNYDKEGRLVEVRTDPNGNYGNSRQEATYTYNKADQIKTVTFSPVMNSNKAVTYSYSPARGWLTKLVNGSNNFCDSLNYYGNGNINIQTLTNSALGGTQSLTYNYDAMNRLSSVMRGGTTMESFYYDNDGNTTYRTYNTQIYSGASYNTINYYYSGNKLSYINYNGTNKSYGYDYKGNDTSDTYSGITDINYDHRNLPLSMTTSTNSTYKYRYDDGGNRLFKDAQGKKEYYFRDDRGHDLAVYDVTTDRLKTINLYGNDLLGRIDVSWDDVYDEMADEWHTYRYDSRFFYVKDHLGSIRQTLNESGAVTMAMDYYAFGATKNSYVVGGSVDKYKFTGKERDSETGLDYFGARYYDSKIGRWMSVDPLGDVYPGWSPYNYSMNNPLLFFDPNGLEVRVYTERLTTKTSFLAAIGMARHSYMYISTPNKSLTLELGGPAPQTGTRGNPIMQNVESDFSPFERRVNPYQETVTRPKGVGENNYSFENKIIEIFNIMKGRLPDYDALNANCNGFVSFLLHAAGGDISYTLFTAYGHNNEQEYWKIYSKYLMEQQNKSSYKKESEINEKKSGQYHGVPERQPQPIF